MAKQVSEDVRDKLVTSGLVQTNPKKQWFVSMSNLPPTPLDVVACVDGSGAGRMSLMDLSKPTLHDEGCQIFVRGRGQRESWVKAKAICDTINRWAKFTQGGTHYQLIQQRGSIAPFSHDEADKTWTLVMNFTVIRKDI